MSIWQALGFMFLGGALVGAFDIRAWQMYKAGRKEAAGGEPGADAYKWNKNNRQR